MEDKDIANSQKEAFQSLFSWNLLLMYHPLTIRHVYPTMFQSLFSWNLLLMLFRIFNRPVVSMFQSLFSWNLLLMTIEKALAGTKEF